MYRQPENINFRTQNFYQKLHRSSSKLVSKLELDCRNYSLRNNESWYFERFSLQSVHLGWTLTLTLKKLAMTWCGMWLTVGWIQSTGLRVSQTRKFKATSCLIITKMNFYHLLDSGLNPQYLDYPSSLPVTAFTIRFLAYQLSYWSSLSISWLANAGVPLLGSP